MKRKLRIGSSVGDITALTIGKKNMLKPGPDTNEKASEDLLAKATKMAGIGSWEFDLVKSTVYWFNVTKEIHETELGFVPVLQTVINFFKEGTNRDLITETIRDGIENGTAWDVEQQIITAKGNEKWIRFVGETEFVNNKCVRLYGVYQDIDVQKRAELAVAEVLKEKNIILESIGDAFFAADRNWVVTYWNKQAERVLQTTKSKILGRNLWEVFSESVGSESYKKYHEAIETFQPVHFEDYYPTLAKWYEISAYPSANGLSVYFKDVTERKLSEIHVNELNADLQKQTRELSVQNEEKEQRSVELTIANRELKKAEEKITKLSNMYAFISQVNQNIVRVQDEATLFHNSCSMAIEFGKFKMAWIGISDNANKKISLVDHCGIPEEDMKLFTDASWQIKGPQDHVLQTGTPYINNEIQNDPEMAAWKSFTVKYGIHSCVVLPIKKSGIIIGTLNLYATELDFSDKEGIALLVEVTGDISFALDLFEKARRQKETEALIVQNETRLRSLIEKGADMITLRSPEGKIFYASPSITTVLGYSTEQLLSTSAFHFIHPDDLPGLVEQTQSLQDTPGGSFCRQQRYLHKNGNWIWCEGTVTNMLREPGINALVTNFRDISERKRTEKKQEFDNNNLDALINNTSDLMWSVDKNFNLITSNQPFDEMGKVNFGKSIAKGGNVLSAAYSPEMLSHFKKLYERAFAGEAFTETEYFEFPVELWTEISYYPIRKGDTVIGTACHSRDITGRKKSEETSLRLGSIVESSRDAIISLSLNGLIVSWNHAAKILYEYSSEEVLGKPYSVLLYPDQADYFAKNVEKVKAGQQPGHFELEHVMKNGKLIYVSLSISPVKDAIGNLTGISTNAHDISKQKMAEIVLKEATYKAKIRWATKIRLELLVGIILVLLILFLSIFFSLPKMIYDAIGNYQDSIIDDLIITMAFLFLIGIIFGIRRFREANRGGQQIQNALKTLTDELEMRIQERTNELSKSNEVLLNEIIERKKTEENLKKSEARLREAQAVAHISNWEINLLTGVNTWSDEFYNIMCVSREDIQPSPEGFLSLIHPDETAHVGQMIKKSYETLENSFFYSRAKTKDGSTKYIYSEYRFEFDNTKKPIRLYGILQDVTDQRNAEEKIKQSENRFREFFEGAPEAIVIYDISVNTFVKFNDNAVKLFKYPAEELLKKGPADISPEFQPNGHSSEEKAKEFTSNAIEGDKPVFEWLFIDANGKEILCEVRLARLSNVGSLQILGTFIDITERKNAEQKIIESELKYRSLIEQASDTIIVVDIEGSILEINSRAEKLFGYTREELLKVKLNDLLFAEDDPERTGEVAKDKTVVYERRIKRKDKTAIDVEVSARRISDGRIFGIFRDISERKTAQEERDRLTADIVLRNKDLEQFAYIVSHNLRAPVANILGASNRLSDHRLSIEKKEALGHGIKESVMKLDNVIKDLNHILQVKHDFTEIKEKVCFSELVDDIKISIKNLIDRDDIEIRYDFSEIDEFLTLKSYMYSIFYNLISNSIKYRQEQLYSLIEIKSHRSKDKLELIFTDNGMGIDLKKRGDQVFGLYKRFHTNIEGKGTGLYMVKTQVETLGGKIGLRSEVNKGVEFKIEFKI